MRISPIKSFGPHISNRAQNKQSKHKSVDSHKNFYHNFTTLNFLGGYSLDLAQTMRNFDTYEQQGKKVYPPDIRSLIKAELDKGNPENKTLIDIHKQKYAELKNCYDLKEAKEKFPEFQNVISDKDITYKEGTFIDDVKSGKSSHFNKEEDLALQLLKLYWGEGFSIDGLGKYIGACRPDILYKFNIPTVSPKYGVVLKYSDKDYNKNFSAYMSQKRLEVLDRKSQKESGEPVYIPRTELSESHKKHISEGLIRYYSEHPHKLGEMSQRQKEYFENNPHQKLRIKKAMLFAWNNTQEGRSIKKYLSKFFKKAGVSFSEFEQNNYEAQTPEQKKTFKEFWDKNKWAIPQFSQAVTKGWQKVKDEENDKQTQETKEVVKPEQKQQEELPDYIFRMLPEKLINKTIEAAKLDTDLYYNLSTPYADFRKDDAFDTNSNSISFSDFCCTMFPQEYQMTLWSVMYSIRNDINHKRLPIKVLNDRVFLSELTMHDEALRTTSYEGDIFQSQQVEYFLRRVARMSYEANHPEMLRYLEKKLDTAYELSNKTQDRTELKKFMGIKS